MVVCKYFQQGYCRYGQNCRFEHVYGTKYNYNANTGSTSGVSDESLVNQVQVDVQTALRGGQWILSCYAPFKEKATLPGLSDLSPEEARLFIYEAKATNTIDQAVPYINNLFREARQKYEELLKPTPAMVKILRSLYKGETVSSPFTNVPQKNSVFGNSTNNTASSIFRSAVQNASVLAQNNVNTNSNTVMFGQNPGSVNNNPSAFGQNTNIFGAQSANNSAAKSLFAAANQSVFGNNQATNDFFKPQDNTTAKSIFAQANQNFFGSNQVTQTSSVFGNEPQNVFGSPSSAFGQQQNSSPFSNVQTQNIFQITDQPTNVFGVANKTVFEQSATSDDSGVYSKIEDLSQDDIEAFKSSDFKLGFVPELPPPRSLCI